MVTVAAYPGELVESITLADGQRVRVRPLRRREDRPVRELYRGLSARTRYLRFFSVMPVLPDAVLHLLTCVDYRRRLTLVAEIETADGVEVVAMGGFAAIDDTDVEVGLVVRDDWQRRGIGVALAARVMRAAGVRGFKRFVAHTLWENSAIRKLLNHVGDIVCARSRQAVSEITFVCRGQGTIVSRSPGG
jgi:GNAT superfamily N-acetyltransferase